MSPRPHLTQSIPEPAGLAPGSWEITRSVGRRQGEGAGSILTHSSPHSPAGISPHRWGKPHGGQWWEGSCGGAAASARELPRQTGDTGQGGNCRAASSSQLHRNQPSVANMEELARSLMESLDIMQICLDLLGKLKIPLQSSAPTLRRAMRKEYRVCLQCCRCLTGSCPHCSEPAAEQALPTLAVILHAVDMLVHEKDIQLELGLGFELAVGGEPVYVWEITQRLPKTAGWEERCEECNAPLPRSPGDSESSQASFPVLRAQGTPKGQRRPARQEARAPPARQTWTKCSDTSRAGLQPAGQGESLPTVVPTWPLPPWAQPPSPAALDRLRKVGMEPLPLVGYKGLGQGISLQRIWQSWSKLKTSVRSSVRAERGQLRIAGTSAPSGTTEGDQTLPLDLRFKVDALFHAMVMEA